MKKGDIIEVEIEKYAFEGRGIAKVPVGSIRSDIGKDEDPNSNYVVFVDGSFTGDKVRAELKKIKKSFAEAKAIEIVSPSRFRIKAKCKYFGECGGCKQQDLDYAQQVKFKQQQTEEIFNKLGGFNDILIEEIIPSEKIFYYRNKMEFSFSDMRWLTQSEINSDKDLERDFALGLHVPQVFDKVLDIDECFLQSEVSNKILNLTTAFFKNKNIKPYSTKTNSGNLRNLIIKTSCHMNELMVNIVTFNDDGDLIRSYSETLLKQVPEITTIVNNINQKKSSVATGDYEKVIYGSGFIYDLIGNYKFRISANSFFQTNTLQAEKLYQTALSFAELSGNEIVYDLYSGAGTISIFVSGKSKEVFAFETVESAVADAGENKKINNIDNVHFFAADLYKSFLPLVEENKLPLPDVVILDPPRSGMHSNTVNDVIKLKPKKIVYVSCNPATQVRDIKLFVNSGYKIIKMRPVDMFPHTYHIENVAVLESH